MSSRPDLNYPAVLNGLDYLLSSVDHLAGAPTSRDLKYAVLHLQAATEVILKARLQDEHFSLVFKEPGKATYANFMSGAFESCSTKDVISRLRNLAQVAIEERDVKAIETLAQTRNSLQHYGLVASAYAIEAQAVRVLDFLLSFSREHLVARYWAPSEELHIIYDTLGRVQEKLPEIRSLIKRRLERAQLIVATQLDRTVQCPTCREWTVPISGTGLNVTCLCCDLEFDAEFYLEWNNWESTEHDPPIPESCLKCGNRQLVAGVKTAASPDGGTSLCFYCGESPGGSAR
ncbi:hypothetical protein ABT272_27015 [Streptomyces sp900105245]|uniref:Uncharacterized protein n=1 Tax=Streptomyces sp. 900105245 TaxID=3154379 RepID=A0ABV1UCA6_9ACTN